MCLVAVYFRGRFFTSLVLTYCFELFGYIGLLCLLTGVLVYWFTVDYFAELCGGLCCWADYFLLMCWILLCFVICC